MITPLRALAEAFDALRTALAFLSQLPTGPNPPLAAEDHARRFRASLAFFPLAGAILGLVTAVVMMAAHLMFPLPLAILVALAVELRVTGAFHEDAVADFLDAFGGGWTREDVLRILKDSRVGSFGAAGLVAAMALRAGGLITIGDPLLTVAALVVAGSLGRLVILFVMRLVPPIGDRESLARDAAYDIDWRTPLLGCAAAAPAALLGLLTHPLGLLLGVGCCVLFVAWYRGFLMRRLGAVTGDCLGFSAYAGMVLITLGFAARY